MRSLQEPSQTRSSVSPQASALHAADVQLCRGYLGASLRTVSVPLPSGSTTSAPLCVYIYCRACQSLKRTIALSMIDSVPYLVLSWFTISVAGFATLLTLLTW